jgi:hypothetical protein
VSAIEVVVGEATYSSSQTGGDSRTDGITPGDGTGSGIVVWGAMLVRAVMDAELEVGFRAEAVNGTLSSATEGASLAEHVGSACFLGLS